MGKPDLPCYLGECWKLGNPEVKNNPEIGIYLLLHEHRLYRVLRTLVRNTRYIVYREDFRASNQIHRIKPN